MYFFKLFFPSPYFKKILSGFLILFFLFSAIYLAIPVKKVSAEIPVIDISHIAVSSVNAKNTTAFNVKKFLLDGIAWTAAKMILQSLTAQTVSWINSGFDGNPAYITDPGQFFTNVADQTVGQALNSQGGLLAKICSPFRPQIRSALVASYLQQNQLGQCSISGAIRDYDAFTQDFSQGGWEGWFSMTQNMQNNPYGSYLAAQDELNISVANQQNKYQKQLDWGKGFLSYEKCATFGSSAPRAERNVCLNPASDTVTNACKQSDIQVYQNGRWVSKGSIGLADAGASGALKNCPSGKTEIVTPGSVIENQLESALGSGVRSLEAADEINEIIGALMTQAIKGVVGGIAGGLRGESQGSGQNSSLSSQLGLNSTQTQTQERQSLLDIQSGLPDNIAQATDASSNSIPITPVIDETASANQVESQASIISCSQANNGLPTPPPTISSVQGINPIDLFVTEDVFAGKYILVHGLDFAPTCNKVIIKNPISNETVVAYEPIKASSKELSFQLGSQTGMFDMQVIGPDGKGSNMLRITIR